MEVDAIIVGGGIAGLQAAIQLGRYMHRIAVIDGGTGRSKLCRQYSNLLGWPQGVSGDTLRASGREQAERLGVQFIDDIAVSAIKEDNKFIISCQNNNMITGSVMLLATGVYDRYDPIKGLEPCFGISVFVCPDCDGYEAKDRRTMIIGSGDIGARMALAVAYWTKDIVLINHEGAHIGETLAASLQDQSIAVIREKVAEIEADDRGLLKAALLQSGERIQAERAFIAFGGNEVRTGLAHELGAERMENGHIMTDPRSKMTSVQGLWAAGDIGVHSEMVTVAMAEGTLSAVWMHKAILSQKT